ncbi:DUF6192 family protein [Spongiactinospora sp. 9N601]|uniref:DUF6192 family protein n=1 Tax=Spongiactinospora sp. 9N601 TaxID=3375149 RepID=UPI0037B96105
MFADALAIPVATLKTYRWVCSRWPAPRRRAGVSYYIHRTLASIRDDEERWKRIADPPLDQRTGEHRWTEDAAKRLFGQQVSRPQTVQEKIERIHDLARDEEVAVRVATDLLRRPQVASRTMLDGTAKHMVNRAQIDHAPQAGEVVRQRSPALPKVEHTRDFIELAGACTVFVAAIGRVLPGMRRHRFTADERAAIAKQVARGRATADWIEAAAESGEVGMDEGLARLLRGE